MSNHPPRRRAMRRRPRETRRDTSGAGNGPAPDSPNTMILITTSDAVRAAASIGITAESVAGAAMNSKRHADIGIASCILRCANVDRPSRSDVARILGIAAQSTVATAEAAVRVRMPTLVAEAPACAESFGTQAPDDGPADADIGPDDAERATLAACGIAKNELDLLSRTKSMRADRIRRHLIRALSTLSGLTQHRIAARLGIPRSAVAYALEVSKRDRETSDAVMRLAARIANGAGA